MLINEQKYHISFINMFDEERDYYAPFLPYIAQDLDEGFKYLGFQLKPKYYRKVDWMWLITKLEKCLQS